MVTYAREKQSLPTSSSSSSSICAAKRSRAWQGDINKSPSVAGMCKFHKFQERINKRNKSWKIIYCIEIRNTHNYFIKDFFF